MNDANQTGVPQTACGHLGRAALLALAIASTVLSEGCSSRESLGYGAMAVVSDGVLNDPSNRALRFDILRFGLTQFCSEMQARSVPIRPGGTSLATGRFFSTQCASQIVDHSTQQGVFVQFQGTGYAWTQVTQRLGFQAGGQVDYSVDFQRHGSRLYVYFRPRSVNNVQFQPTLVESALAQLGIALSGSHAEQIGRELLSSELSRGFTVIRHSGRGETQFAPGLIAPGQLPPEPFDTSRSKWKTLANLRTTIQPQQQDFIRGLVVSDKDSTLRMSWRLNGAPVLDGLLVPQPVAEGLLRQYLRSPGPSVLPGPAAMEVTLTQGVSPFVEFHLPPGQYYLLLDNSHRAGRSAPAATYLPATVDLLLQQK